MVSPTELSSRPCDVLDEENLVLRLFGLLRVHILLKRNAELFAQRLELIQILLVLALVLDLGLDALEDPNGGGEVVDSPRGPKGGGHDGGGGDEIVGEGVVQVALELENVLNTVKLLLVAGRKLLEGLLLVLGAQAGGCAKARGGEDGARGDGLRPGSDEVGAEKVGGAASGNAEQGGRHFCASNDEKKKRPEPGRVVRRAIGGVGRLNNGGLARESLVLN
jgi:hypothetical protein